MKKTQSFCEKCNKKTLTCPTCERDMEIHSTEYEKFHCFAKKVLIKQVRLNGDEWETEYIHLLKKCGKCIFKSLLCCI